MAKKKKKNKNNRNLKHVANIALLFTLFLFIVGVSYWWSGLKEETSIDNIKIIKEIDGWLEYELPKNLLGIIWKGKFNFAKCIFITANNVQIGICRGVNVERLQEQN